MCIRITVNSVRVISLYMRIYDRHHLAPFCRYVLQHFNRVWKFVWIPRKVAINTLHKICENVAEQIFLTTSAPLVAASHAVVCSSFLDSLASYSAFALSSLCQRNLAISGALNGTCFVWNPGPYVRILDMQVSPFLKLLSPCRHCSWP